MFDIRAIRDNPEEFDAGWARRGLEPRGKKITEGILNVDEAVRFIQGQLQNLQQVRNAKSKEIGQLKKMGQDATDLMGKVAHFKDSIGKLEEEEREKASELRQILSSLPNIMSDDVPDGADESANVEMRKIGEIKVQSGPDHVEIGEALGMMDFEVAAKMSGSRFVLLKSGLARMERALAQFFLDTHTGEEHGFTEISPPLLVCDNALYGTGQLPKFSEDLFKTGISQEEVKNLVDKAVQDIERKKNDGEILDVILTQSSSLEESFAKYYGRPRFLIPTSEVPLTNIVAD